MKNKEISNILKNFRTTRGYSQSELASALGVSQEHISRVERGATQVSKKLEEKILRIAKSNSNSLSLLGSNYKKRKFGQIRISSYLAPEDSGDRIEVIDQKNEKTLIIHLDATGHGKDAKLEADQLVWLMKVISVILDGPFLTIESVYVAIDRVIKITKNDWIGYPGCSLVLYNHSSETISYLNAGMPTAYYYDPSKRGIELLKSQNATVGNLSSSPKIKIEHFSLNKNGFLFLYSDGFKEFYSRISSLPLENILESYCEALSGDTDSIISKIAKSIENKESPSDDISFLGIGL